MTLTGNQTALTLSHLYSISEQGTATANNPFRQIQPNLFVNSGTVSVYGYNGATKPTALSGMVLNSTPTVVAGILPFDILPTYIAVVQVSGTSTEVVITDAGIVTDLGVIS